MLKILRFPQGLMVWGVTVREMVDHLVDHRQHSLHPKTSYPGQLYILPHFLGSQGKTLTKVIQNFMIQPTCVGRLTGGVP